MKSKICILVVTIISLVLSITNFKSIASTNANIIVDSKDVIEGDEVEINIKLQNSIDFSAANFIVRYDSSILEYIDYAQGNSLKDQERKCKWNIAFK